MKIAVVFDSTSEAHRNLQAALRSFKNLPTPPSDLQMDLQVHVYLLELWQPEQVETTLAEQEQANLARIRHNLARIRQVMGQERKAEVTLEIVRGEATEVAYSIARKAKKWGANQLYVELGRACPKCVQAAAHKNFFNNFLGMGRLSCASQVESSAPRSAVTLESLVNLGGSQVIATCHGETVLTVQKYLPRTKSHCDRIVYERLPLIKARRFLPI